MPDVRAFQLVVEAAEQAAAAGDFATAETRLREAADLQEAEEGPLHPDLASTFNNLAVVCEMADKPADAEQFYRRAHAIAATTLAADHPLLATSRDNLRDFCAARGIPLDEWPAAPGSHAAAPPRRAPTPPPPIAPPAAATPTIAASPARWPLRRASAWAAVVLVFIAGLAADRWWSGPAPFAALDVTPANPTAAPTPAPAPESMPAAPPMLAPEPEPAAPPVTAPAAMRAPPTVAEPVPDVRPAATTGRESAAPASGARDARGSAVRVVTAEVCRTLTTGAGWRCAAVGAESAPGRVSFYTRVASPQPLRVHHRWYLGDTLRQDVPLRVGANPRDGYRTFSRQAVSAGEWRVELRNDDGAVLGEVRFAVR